MLGVILSLWLGLFFSWCARPRIRVDGIWAQPALAIVGAFMALALVPSAVYLHLVHPAWSSLYLYDPAKVSRLIVVPLVLAQAGSLLGGWVLGVRLVRLDRPHVVGATAAGVGALLALSSFLLRGRLLRYGTYEDFHSGVAASLGAVRLGYVLVALVAGFASAAAITAWELRRDGRRAAAG